MTVFGFVFHPTQLVMKMNFGLAHLGSVLALPFNSWVLWTSYKVLPCLNCRDKSNNCITQTLRSPGRPCGVVPSTYRVNDILL